VVSGPERTARGLGVLGSDERLSHADAYRDRRNKTNRFTPTIDFIHYFPPSSPGWFFIKSRSLLGRYGCLYNFENLILVSPEAQHGTAIRPMRSAPAGFQQFPGNFRAGRPYQPTRNICALAALQIASPFLRQVQPRIIRLTRSPGPSAPNTPAGDVRAPLPTSVLSVPLRQSLSRAGSSLLPFP
jgi:hypothetical protein